MTGVTCFSDRAAKEAGLLGFLLQLSLHSAQLGKLATGPPLERLLLALQQQGLGFTLPVPGRCIHRGQVASAGLLCA